MGLRKRAVLAVKFDEVGGVPGTFGAISPPAPVKAPDMVSVRIMGRMPKLGSSENECRQWGIIPVQRGQRI